MEVQDHDTSLVKDGTLSMIIDIHENKKFNQINIDLIKIFD